MALIIPGVHDGLFLPSNVAGPSTVIPERHLPLYPVRIRNLRQDMEAGYLLPECSPHLRARGRLRQLTHSHSPRGTCPRQ